MVCYKNSQWIFLSFPFPFLPPFGMASDPGNSKSAGAKVERIGKFWLACFAKNSWYVRHAGFIDRDET